MPESPRRISLVLGAGGARGYAHIGAIQVLEERGHEIVAISGCSMGALVGGLHAAGSLGDFTDWALSLRQREVLRLLDVSLGGPSILRAQRVLGWVAELIDGRAIEELPIPFTAVATDLVAQREVWFQTGPLELAIRASIALPGILPPVVLGDQLLVDGGLLDAIPVAPTAATPSDLTLAIALSGERQVPRASPTTQRAAAERARRGAPALPGDAPVSDEGSGGLVEEWMTRLRAAANAATTRAAATTLRGAASGEPADADGDGYPDDLTRVGIMNAALETMQGTVARHRLAAFPPDVLVEVPRDACRTLDFHRASDLIAIGRTLTEQALDRVDAR